LKVLATTSIVGDVVAQVGGEAIDLTILLPRGIDPHAFEATPQDVATISEAAVIFANGAGLEGFLVPLLESAGASDRVVDLSARIELKKFVTEMDRPLSHEGEGTDKDPHVWTNPNNVIAWVEGIQRTLSELDPQHAVNFAANAQVYVQKLTELDAWVREQVAQIPPDQRMIVTDHLIFGYFAEEYGFTQVGAIIPGFSTLSEASAGDLARLEDAIREMNVKAIFVGNTVNPNLAQRVAEDTGAQVVFVYTGSLSKEGGEADTYLDYIRYNVTAIVTALR
jgi:ABC-type Zn uptake system ZnuABC Zn-binding protein ZnuA